MAHTSQGDTIEVPLERYRELLVKERDYDAHCLDDCLCDWCIEQANNTPKEPLMSVLQPTPQDLLSRITACSAADPKTLNMRIMKLASEVGELCDVGLALTNTPSLRYKNLGRPELIRECADVALCYFSILQKANVTHEEITEALEEKLTKWEAILQ